MMEFFGQKVGNSGQGMLKLCIVAPLMDDTIGLTEIGFLWIL